ncbi:MAG TPA: ABC transporter ATP-binding protein [Anaerolineales bacterium]|nr:ABC transporter ATP-binding protein [Anaerolineales bacterium]
MTNPLSTSQQPSSFNPRRPLTGLLWRVYGYLKPYWQHTCGAYLALLAILGLNITLPQFIRWIIDTGIANNQPGVLAWSVLALLGLTLLKGVLTYFEGLWNETASQNVAYDLRNHIQRKLTLLSFSFHDQTETGELLSRAVQDVERIRFLTGRATLRILEGTLMLIGTSLVLLSMDARLALPVIAILPLLIYRALHFGRRYRPLSILVQQQLAVLTTAVEQNLRGSRVVKAYAQEGAEIEIFDRENSHWFDLSVQAAQMQAINIPLLFMIANAGLVLIIWYGGRQVIHGELTLGVLVAFMTYLGQLIEPVRRLGLIIPVVAIAGSAAERIFEILDAIPEVEDEPGAKPLPPIEGKVHFDHVSFSYGRRQVLNDIDFEVQPGQVVALLGPTGSGKSTITNLLPRFYDPTSGCIQVDGHDIRQVRLLSLRSQIGIVLQETTLFATTVRENIAFGCAGAAEEEIVQAARAAQAHEFISRMPQGYDTRVGERGVTLSGGQKQRLAIARALLLDPRILILDDATASVDTETEHLIQQAFERLMQDRTTFVIAHRLSTVRRADLILVLDGGEIVARGTHDSLLGSSRLYTEIYQHQLKPQQTDERIRAKTSQEGTG